MLAAPCCLAMTSPKICVGSIVPVMLSSKTCSMAARGTSKKDPSGETVAQQFADAPAAVILTISMIIFGSLISYQANTEPSPVGPFTKEKELLNGRAAMVGMACLLGFEAVKHTALL